MRNQPSWIALGAIVVGLGSFGCGERREEAAAGTDQAPPAADMETEAAYVRVVNAIPAAQPADVYAGDTKTFSGVQYKAVTPYREIADARASLRVEVPGGAATTQPQIEEISLVPGDRYTVIALPGADQKGPELKVLNDDVAPPEAGKAKVRVVNAGRATGAVEIGTAGAKDALVKSVSAGDASGYEEVEPVSAPLVVRKDDGKSVVAEVKDGALEAGKLYTIVVMGPDPASGKAEAKLVEDGAQMTGAGRVPDTGVRPAPDRGASPAVP